MQQALHGWEGRTYRPERLIQPSDVGNLVTAIVTLPGTGGAMSLLAGFRVAQLGSGLAESACKRFGTDRMKGAGMRWSVAGAQQVATLRMLLLSDRWQEVADHCRRAA